MKFRPIYYLVLTIGLLSVTACDEFEDFNTNPNEPTEVTPDVLLAGAIRNSLQVSVNQAYLLSNNAAQLTSKVLRTEIDAYNWNAFPSVWNGFYRTLTDITAVEDLAIASENPQLEGAAIVLKTWIYANLTNLYGDIPYQNAIGGQTGDFTPVFSSQEDIYNDMIPELARADQLLAQSGGLGISGDLLLNNDAGKWRKFANSLRLRLLMTAGNQLPNAASDFAAIVNAGNIMTSNADNATLAYLGSFPNQYPVKPIKLGDFDAVALSKNAYNTLSGYRDPRLMRYARPDNLEFNENAVFSGATNGGQSGICTKVGSRLGVQYYNIPGQPTDNSLGLNSADGIIMTYAEVEFLLAEAAAKGWIAEDIETHYRRGIEASHGYHQVDYAPFDYTDFNDFYENSGVAYNTTTDVWEQKWLALFFHGFEPYFELRRWYHESGMSWEGIPFVEVPCENLNNDLLPLRFPYPEQEQSLNSENYQIAVDKIGGSNDQNAGMWLVQ